MVDLGRIGFSIGDRTAEIYAGEGSFFVGVEHHLVFAVGLVQRLVRPAYQRVRVGRVPRIGTDAPSCRSVS